MKTMPFFLLALFLVLLAPARAGIFSSPPDNEYIQYAAPDLQAQFRSEWQSEGLAKRDALEFLVHAEDARYRRFWVLTKTYDIDLHKKDKNAPDHPDPQKALPPIDGFMAMYQAEMDERANFWRHSGPSLDMEKINRDTGNQGAVLGLLFFGFLFLIGLCLYFIPTGIAILRRSPQLFAVIMLNLFLGWTIVGWGAALIIACWATKKTAS